MKCKMFCNLNKWGYPQGASNEKKENFLTVFIILEKEKKTNKM